MIKTVETEDKTKLERKDVLVLIGLSTYGCGCTLKEYKDGTSEFTACEQHPDYHI